jgi:putative DNA primase/helicase
MTKPDPFAPIGGGGERTAKSSWTIVVPVPADSPAPTEHFKLGKPTTTWTYTDAAGQVLGYVLRFDGADGKSFRPLTLWRPSAGGKAEWRWESWPAKRPLYGLQRLAKRPSAAVVICEGEKATDAATRLLPNLVAVTSPNGSKSASNADWSPLRGRTVTVWPDADTPGLEYANAVAKYALATGANSVAIVSPPEGVAIGWDAADALADGWETARATRLIAAAKPAATHDAAKSGGGRDDAPQHDASGGRRRRAPKRDTLISLTKACELWHDADRVAYATFDVNSHREHWPIRSREFRMWLSGQFYDATGGAVGGQSLEDSIRILEARAVHHGSQYEPNIRVGRSGANLYLDGSELARGGDHRAGLVGDRQAGRQASALILHAAFA